MNLQDMTFEPSPMDRVPDCPEHGAACIGHAWRVEDVAAGR